MKAAIFRDCRGRCAEGPSAVGRNRYRDLGIASCKQFRAIVEDRSPCIFVESRIEKLTCVGAPKNRFACHRRATRAYCGKTLIDESGTAVFRYRISNRALTRDRKETSCLPKTIAIIETNHRV